MKLTVWLPLLTGLLLLARCEGGADDRPIDRTSAALTTTTNAKHALEGVADALALLEDSALLERLADAFGGGGTICSSARDEQGEWSDEACYEEPADLDLGLAETGDKLATWLEAAVFAEAQVEEEGETLTILLDPQIFCQAPWGDDGGDAVGRAPRPADPMGAGGGDSGSPEYYEPESIDDDGEAESDDEVDDECADFLAKVPVRLRFTATAEDVVDVDVLFGEARVDPFDVTVGPGALAVEVDLAVAKQAGQVISEAFAVDGDVIEIPQVVKGTVRLELERDDAGTWTFTGAVLEPVTLDKDLNGQHSRFTAGPSALQLAAEADGSRVAFSVTLGAIALSVPYQWIVDTWADEGDDAEPSDDALMEPPADEPPQVSGNLSLELPAFTGAVEFLDAAQTLTLSDLGLPGGALRFSRDDTTLASLLLNADAEGVVDALLDLAGQNARVTISPHVDLAIDLHLAALADELTDLPSFVLDETWQVLFDEAVAPTLVILDGGVDEAVQVTAGTLRFTSTAAPDQAVTVPAGSCLTFAGDHDAPSIDEGASEAAPTAEHEILSTLVSGTCP